MKSFVRRLLVGFLFTGLIPFPLAFATPENAEVTDKDFQVIMRSIGFLQNSPSGDRIFAIVYYPGSEESSHEARQLQNLFNDNASSISPRLVSVEDLSQLSNASFVFVTAGLGRYQQK